MKRLGDFEQSELSTLRMLDSSDKLGNLAFIVFFSNLLCISLLNVIRIQKIPRNCYFSDLIGGGKL